MRSLARVRPAQCDAILVAHRLPERNAHVRGIDLNITEPPLGSQLETVRFWMQNSTQSWESATAVAIASLPITLKSAFQMRRTRIGAAYGLRVPLAALGALTLMMLHAKVNKNQDRE